MVMLSRNDLLFRELEARVRQAYQFASQTKLQFQYRNTDGILVVIESEQTFKNLLSLPSFENLLSVDERAHVQLIVRVLICSICKGHKDPGRMVKYQSVKSDAMKICAKCYQNGDSKDFLLMVSDSAAKPWRRLSRRSTNAAMPVPMQAPTPALAAAPGADDSSVLVVLVKAQAPTPALAAAPGADDSSVLVVPDSTAKRQKRKTSAVSKATPTATTSAVAPGAVASSAAPASISDTLPSEPAASELAAV